MADSIIAIVDGTGDDDDVQYRSDMTHSFCVQIAEGFGLTVGGATQENANARYERGPATMGSGMNDKADAAAKFLTDRKTVRPDAKLFLAGYSRGASAVIMAAERMARLLPAVMVDGMFLFDAVARHVYSGGEVIPANVLRVWSAVRRLDADLLKKYDSRFARVSSALANPGTAVLSPVTYVTAAAAAYVSKDWVHPMRPGFGMTGVQYLGAKGHFDRRFFAGSHGALGGVGWKDVDEDAKCQTDVADFMTEALKLAGLSHITLRSHPPTQVWK